MKLVSELATQAQGPTLYVLDEPTTGLHRSDVQRLLALPRRASWSAATPLLVIEHHPDVMLAADYLLELGPEGGEGGGQVVASGTPLEVSRVKASHTGKALREALQEARSTLKQAGRTQRAQLTTMTAVAPRCSS